MKRTLLALALIVLMGGYASAETMTWGLKGGLNLADLTGDGISGNEMKLVGVAACFSTMPYRTSSAFNPRSSSC